VRIIFSVGLLGLGFIILGHVPLGILAWRTRALSPVSLGVAFYLMVMLVANLKELHLAPRGGAALLAIFAMTTALRYERLKRPSAETSPVDFRSGNSSNKSPLTLES